MIASIFSSDSTTTHSPVFPLISHSASDKKPTIENRKAQSSTCTSKVTINPLYFLARCCTPQRRPTATAARNGGGAIR